MGENSLEGWGQKQITKFVMFNKTWVLFQYLVDNYISKDDLKFLKQLKGVNQKSNGDRIIFKHYKHVGLI